MPTNPSALTDETLVAHALGVVAAQKSTLTGIGGLAAKLAWPWFVRVVETYLTKWVVDIVVKKLAGVTLADVAEWLVSRFATVSNEVSSVVSGGFGAAVSLPSVPAAQYAAYEDPDFPGVWHVSQGGKGGVVEVTFHDGKEKAVAYARLINTGIPIC